MSPPTADPATPSACLAALVAADAGRPRLTSVRPDERLDLSATTLANWVAKTAHFLRDDVGVSPGDRVGLCLPRHWLAAVWLLAADAVGARLTVVAAESLPQEPEDAATALLGRGPETAVAALVGPGPDAGEAGAAVAGLAATAAARGCELLVASLRPFGLPTDGPLPPGARDLAEAVRAFPDTAAPVEADPQLPLLVGADGIALSRADVQRSARRHAAEAGWPTSARVLANGPVDARALVEGLLAPWSVDGSAVWVGNLAAAALVSVTEQERITART